MKNIVSKLNNVITDCKSSLMDRYYSAVRFFAYAYFYYFMHSTAEQW